MHYSLNNSSLTFYQTGYQTPILRIKGDVVIAIDPSKTNMALFIGSPFSEHYASVEFTGNYRSGGTPEDTTLYCEEVRTFLRSFLKNVNLYIVGVEAAISKRGMDHHHSSMVLTEIRGNILNFFLEEYHIKVDEINNWAWKHAILPEGYRGQKEKGSKRFVHDFFPDNPLNDYYAADMTDAFCMYLYIVKTKCQSYSLICNRIEEPVNPNRKFFLYPSSFADIQIPHCRNVALNDHFSLDENVSYLGNRTLLQCKGLVEDINTLSLRSIYGHATGFETLEDTSATLLIEKG